MEQVTITRRIEWDAAHRLGDGYKMKCKHLHGHRYTAEVTFQAPALDEHGMILDLGFIKHVCGGWVDRFLDHGTLVYAKDVPLRHFLSIHKQKNFVVEFNTTVEQITPWLAGMFQELVTEWQEEEARDAEETTIRRATLTHLRVYETPNGWATWTKDKC